MAKITPCRAVVPGTSNSKSHLASSSAVLGIVLAFALAVLLVPASWFDVLAQPGAGPERQLRVFAPQTSYVVPLIDHNGAEYVGLLELLEPLGRVESRVDKQKWKLKFVSASNHSVEVEFTQGTSKGKLAASGYDLPAEFVMIGGRGFVPVAALRGLLPRLVSQTVELDPGNRLLIGSASFSYHQELHHNPPSLVLAFPSPVNPTIATEPGHIRFTFTREPVAAPANGGSERFSDPVFQSSSVTAANGMVQLTINVATPVMATFSDGGKAITIVAAQRPQPAAAPANPPVAATPPETPKPVAPPRPVVVIDAAHGGSDRGAILADNAAEKDVTLALARRIQHELEARGIATHMVRLGDVDLGFDQRAATANSTHILAYIAVHAASEGHGVRVYTALLPAPAGKPNRKQFLPWDSAQAGWLDVSGSLAASIAAELGRHSVVTRTLPSPLRPLNNIWAPAVAVEVAPSEGEDESLKSSAYLQTIAGSVAAAVATLRPVLEAAR